MITFLPLPDFAQSAAVLDWRRLGKQRSEALHLLEALVDSKSRNHRHPACMMWWGARNSLVEYGVIICQEWVSRGYDDNTERKILAFKTSEVEKRPRWLGESNFHSSHRAALLSKDPVWYGKFGWTDSPLLPYIWPTNADPRIFRFML